MEKTKELKRVEGQDCHIMIQKSRPDPYIRQNILNNPYALQEIEKATQIQGIPFEGKTIVLKEQVSVFFEVTPRTIETILRNMEKNYGKTATRFYVVNG